MEYYVYEHLTLDGERFYIGMGKGDRFKTGSSRNDEWHKKTINGLRWNIIACGLTRAEAFELESLICEEIGYDKLANVSPDEHSRRIANTWTEQRRLERGNALREINKASYKPVVIDGVEYDSIRAAHRATGIARSIISKKYTK